MQGNPVYPRSRWNRVNERITEAIWSLLWSRRWLAESTNLRAYWVNRLLQVKKNYYITRKAEKRTLEFMYIKLTTSVHVADSFNFEEQKCVIARVERMSMMQLRLTRQRKCRSWHGGRVVIETLTLPSHAHWHVSLPCYSSRGATSQNFITNKLDKNTAITDLSIAFSLTDVFSGSWEINAIWETERKCKNKWQELSSNYDSLGKINTNILTNE